MLGTLTYEDRTSAQLVPVAIFLLLCLGGGLFYVSFIPPHDQSSRFEHYSFIGFSWLFLAFCFVAALRAHFRIGIQQLNLDSDRIEIIRRAGRWSSSLADVERITWPATRNFLVPIDRRAERPNHKNIQFKFAGASFSFTFSNLTVPEWHQLVLRLHAAIPADRQRNWPEWVHRNLLSNDELRDFYLKFGFGVEKPSRLPSYMTALAFMIMAGMVAVANFLLKNQFGIPYILMWAVAAVVYVAVFVFWKPVIQREWQPTPSRRDGLIQKTIGIAAWMSALGIGVWMLVVIAVLTAGSETGTYPSWWKFLNSHPALLLSLIFGPPAIVSIAGLTMHEISLNRWSALRAAHVREWEKANSERLSQRLLQIGSEQS